MATTDIVGLRRGALALSTAAFVAWSPVLASPARASGEPPSVVGTVVCVLVVILTLGIVRTCEPQEPPQRQR